MAAAELTRRMGARTAAVLLMASQATAHVAEDAVAIATLAWQPTEIVLHARQDHPWEEFPVVGKFVHDASGDELTVEAFWDGGRRWVIRFAPPRVGPWRYETRSDDPGLDGRRGLIHAAEPSADQVRSNPNLRGRVEIAADGRTFQYADGEPLLLMGDTLWAGNSARCGLGDDRDGPFYEYLADRKSKGFNAVLMRYINGFGDEQHNPLGHRNEGGRLFEDGGQDRINPDYFRSLDQRVAALADYGFVAVVPISWWGKTRVCPIEFDLATQLSAYCAVRYAAYNTIWALSGEYQYAFQDCGWTPEQFDQLGATLQQHNAYRRPTSIHPSSRTDFDPPHNGQSSRAYHRSPWLDHHWLQTGQRVSSLRNIPLRAAEVRDLSPVRPVFCSEGFYESADDQDGAYHARWQVWQAVLAGCAGYGYGAHGVWQFFDPHDPDGETGKPVAGSVPWRQALQLPGASQVRHALTLLSDLPWPETTPCTERLRVDGAPVARPTSSDLSPPVAAAMGTDDYVLYLPRGNGAADIELMAHHSDGAYHAEWFDPRTADRITCGQVVVDRGRLRVPSRPTPGDEDWVLWLRAADDTQRPVGIDR